MRACWGVFAMAAGHWQALRECRLVGKHEDWKQLFAVEVLKRDTEQ